jgi:hypothetical protein
MFQQNTGIMVAVDQLAAVQPRFATLQNEFRRFNIDIVRASVRHAKEQGVRPRSRPRTHCARLLTALRAIHHGLPPRGHRQAGCEALRRQCRPHPADDLEEDALRLLIPTNGRRAPRSTAARNSTKAYPVAAIHVWTWGVSRCGSAPARVHVRRMLSELSASKTP